MLENWTSLECVAAFIVACGFGAPVIYAWADRWLDRTRKDEKKIE